MALRKIFIASQIRQKELHSEATTWGQLKDALQEFGDLSQMRVVVKETRGDLQSNEAILPEGDFTLLLSPLKIKAGSVDVAAILRDLQEKFNRDIDEIVESIEVGDYDTVADTVSQLVNVPADTAEMLRKLSAGNF